MRSRSPNASLALRVEGYLRRRYIEAPRERQPDAVYIEAEIGELSRVISTYVLEEAQAAVRYDRKLRAAQTEEE